MITQEILLQRIEAKGIYNFRDLLDSHATVCPEDELQDKILNTIELFAFGGCPNYAKEPNKYIALTDRAKQKLVELSILSKLGENVGNEVKYTELLPIVQPYVRDIPTLDMVLISMIDAQTVKLKIDEERSLLRIFDTPVLRDAYNETNYRLRNIKHEHLMVMSVGRAKKILQKWLHESVVPVRKELCG
ncbi:hypothetical protein JCM33374_g3776 [Metschnikowia sp. JCM 33374]|nr:hypothetical protein JCM33374_g3776 [Metschnikowia sp. JCM 33374]